MNKSATIKISWLTLQQLFAGGSASSCGLTGAVVLWLDVALMY